MRLSEPCNRGALKTAHRAFVFLQDRPTSSPLYGVIYKELLATALPGKPSKQAPRFLVTLLQHQPSSGLTGEGFHSGSLPLLSTIFWTRVFRALLSYSGPVALREGSALSSTGPSSLCRLLQSAPSLPVGTFPGSLDPLFRAWSQGSLTRAHIRDFSDSARFTFLPAGWQIAATRSLCTLVFVIAFAVLSSFSYFCAFAWFSGWFIVYSVALPKTYENTPGPTGAEGKKGWQWPHRVVLFWSAAG